MDDTIETLRAENVHLAEQNQIKSEWISIAAHQMRTSLSAIKWILKMFLDGDFGTLSPEQDSMMKKAFTSNERLLALTQEMLSLNHTDSHALTYEFAENDIAHLIQSTIFEFTGESYKKGVEVVHLAPEHALPLFSFDKEKVRFIIENLIENAIKYSDRGDRVIITSRLENDHVMLTVTDTGIGIPKTEQARIFEKFYRAANAKAKEAIGSGLGLYTAKQIAEKHGGTLVFESEEGQGTTFTLALPLQPSKS